VRASVTREGDRLLIRSGAGRVIAEIDLLNAVIKTVVPGIILHRFRTHALREFTSVALQECIRSIEEGYLVAEYTVVLQGAKIYLNILSTYNREEALTIQKELCMILSLPCNGLQRAEDTVDRATAPGQRD
jgi:hypothetical protein